MSSTLNDPSEPPVILTLMRFPDARCVDVFTEMELHFPTTDPAWRLTSTLSSGSNTILHLAAILGKIATLQWIMSRPLGAELLTTRNSDGHDPLQALLDLLEQHRTEAHCSHAGVEHQFRGFNDRFVQCLVALKGLRDPSVEELARLKGGCTCRHCLEGIVSPRMGRALLREINTSLVLWLHIPTGASGAEATTLWPDRLAIAPEPELDLRPSNPEVRAGIDILRDGHALVLGLIAECLRQGKLPTEREIMALGMGTADDASMAEAMETRVVVADMVQTVFGCAMQHERMDGRLLVGRFMQQSVYCELPECRNDGEYRSAVVRCGYDCKF